MLSEQDTRDHEPGDHKEDVHAHIAATETRDMSVEQDDERDRHCSQTLDVGAKLPILGCGTRLVTRALESFTGGTFSSSPSQVPSSTDSRTVTCYCSRPPPRPIVNVDIRL